MPPRSGPKGGTLRERRLAPRIARPEIERSIVWPFNYRRLTVRYERKGSHVLAILVVARPDPSRVTGAQRLVSYLVSTMPPGKVRVSTRFKLTQLSSAVKNGVPPPTKTG